MNPLTPIKKSFAQGTHNGKPKRAFVYRFAESGQPPLWIVEAMAEDEAHAQGYTVTRAIQCDQ